MYNPGQEMSSINFGAIIGGTLNAVVTAQSQSANTTVFEPECHVGKLLCMHIVRGCIRKHRIYFR